MSTIPVTAKKPPSAGTKVDLGAAAPIRPENAGPVPPDSLAAESAVQGGEFAKNRGVDPNTLSSSNNNNNNNNNNSSSSSKSKSNSNSNKTSSNTGASSKAEPAPTYVLNQYIRDPKGPHGKNIREGFDDEEGVRDGVQEAFRAEPGSENDPAREAERELLKSRIKPGRYAGPRETGISGPMVFEKLDSDVQA